MVNYDFNIGAQVQCKNGACGKLHKVVLDPHTQRVTDLIVGRGFLLTTDRVLPVDAVAQAAGEEIALSMTSDVLDTYPEYRETEFTAPVSGTDGGTYQPDDIRCWHQNYQMVCTEPVIPMARRQIRRGVASTKSVIERGTPVQHGKEVLGHVDHVLVDPESNEITHIVIRKGLLPYYPIVGIEKVEGVRDSTVYCSMTNEEVALLPRYRSRDAEDIETELRNALTLSPHDFSAVQIAVEGSVVTLEGHVRTMQAKRCAEALAHATPGVVGVDNGLATELSVTAQVQHALFSDPRTEIAAIEILNDGGVVTLKGAVDSPEIRKIAGEIANAQPGVLSVINDLRVAPDEDTEFLKTRLLAIMTTLDSQ